MEEKSFIEKLGEKMLEEHIFKKFIAVDLAVCFLVGVASVYRIISYKSNKNFDYQQQIQKLESISDDLVKFQDFISEQKIKISEEQSILEEINQKRKENETYLSLENTEVKAIMSLINKEKKQTYWFDLTLSYLIGLLSSASITILFIWLEKRKQAIKNQSEQEAEQPPNNVCLDP
jgi:vacuolar-type H+-ATPase subunit I/STV1